ncbi:MAG: lipid IV(A) 3-deoxy-D-manno-octulosonic acid transferase [Steroidobacteraceae bacterium]
MRYLYRLLVYLLAPVFFGAMLLRGLRDRSYWRKLAERFGYGPGTAGSSIWVHAVSVGEVQAAAALVHALGDRHPEMPLVVTTVTPTGAERARALLGADVLVRYLPYDLPGAVRRFLDRIRPHIAIVIETELWPNLYHACGARGVPLVLASARLSPRSIRRYRLLARLFAETLSHGIVIAAQSAADAQRFRSIGAPPDRTHVTGNLKFDFAPPADIADRGVDIRRAQAAGRPVWIAGSTHPGEEERVLAAHRRVRAQVVDALLILVPRHPSRFGEVAALLHRERVSFVTRSSRQNCSPDTEVMLVDTLGELVAFYAASDVAFVAGSLVPIGGHNLLEPAALGRAILTGPYNFKGQDVADLLFECRAAERVANSEELAAAVVRLLRDPDERARMGGIARDTVQSNRGALARLLELVEPLLLR